MGHRTAISDSEFERAWTTGPEVEGYDVEAEAEKSEKPKSRSKKVEADEKPEPTTSGVAKTKAK